MSKKRQGANQHYVPQFYLKGFTFEAKDGSARLWPLNLNRFDIPRAKGTKKICSADSFYDLDPSSGAKDEQLFDKWLTYDEEAEPLFKRRVEELIATEGRSGISKEMKPDWARMMVVQRMRTVAAREFILDIERAALAEFLGKTPQSDDFDEAAFHWEHFNHPRWKFVEEMWVRRFWWFVFVNETDVPFITSDNPVSFNQLMFDKRGRWIKKQSWTNGAIPKFAIHYFPVSSKICVAFAHDWAALVALGEDGGHHVLEGELGRAMVDFINERQLFSARHYVLGSCRDSLERVAKLAKRNKEIHPTLWDKERDLRRAITVNGESLTPAELADRFAGVS